MAQTPADEQAQGIPGSALPGPFPVGRYAHTLRERMRAAARVQLIGEVVNVRTSRTKIYFELRDADGAVGCSAWRSDLEKLADGAELRDGQQLVVAGGPDYYVGSRHASPSFSFNVTALKQAGEGDLLARIAQLRALLEADGLLEPQKLLARPSLPRTIAVVTAKDSRAQGDVLAGLERRGWRGTLIWAFVPVQDRHAAPQIARALRDLAATGRAEVAIVARGGGSVADLLAFSDEALCRTVAMLPLPVIASVGHHYDHTLIDDVAAVSCSTPTHAAEAAVPVDVNAARDQVALSARRVGTATRRSLIERARHLALLSAAPAARLRGSRLALHQDLRELRASAQRRIAGERRAGAARADAIERRRAAQVLECRGRRRDELERLALALGGHDPQRTLERGYVLARRPDGTPLTSAAQALPGTELVLRFADGERDAMISEQ